MLHPSRALAAFAVVLVGWLTLPGGGPGDTRDAASPVRLGRLAPVAAAAMTPYASMSDSAAFLQAAAVELDRSSDSAESAVADLSIMRDRYNVNTVNVYGLETWDPSGVTTRKDALFAALARLNMKIVVRIESYDPAAFAFLTADAEAVVNAYRPLLQYVSDPGRRSRVSYFGLNMPVDDPAVQARLGGVNSTLSKTRQAGYAQELVSRMRSVLSQYGFGAAALRLNIFYGWDCGYDLPSYVAARADGYVITVYSYPAGSVAGETAAPDVLINAPRLRLAMDRYGSQYGGASVVVEYGFHTVEYNGGVVPAQTAGLVSTLAAKQRALTATTAFYRGGYSNVTGTSYFGFDLFKHEGSASDVDDWALRYP